MPSSAASPGNSPSKRKHQPEDGQDPSSKKHKDASPSDLDLGKLRLTSEDDDVPMGGYQPPLPPVCVTAANADVYIMPEDADYTLNMQLTACWETRFPNNVTCHGRWVKAKAMRGLKTLRDEPSPDRRIKFFGLLDDEKAKALVNVFISMRRNAGKVLAFSAEVKKREVEHPVEQQEKNGLWVHSV